MSPMKANPKRAAMEELMREGVSQPEAYERVFGQKHASAQFGTPESNVSLEQDLERQKDEALKEAKDRDLSETSDIQRTPNIAYPPLSIPFNTNAETLNKALGFVEGANVESSPGADTDEDEKDKNTDEDKKGEGELTVEFASSAAKEFAEENKLIDDDFDGVEPSSENGYTKDDVKGVVDEKNSDEENKEE